MDTESFVSSAITAARKMGFRVEMNRKGLLQIDFGNKKLHELHLRQLFPAIVEKNVNISSLIEKIAAGRPCTHKPMKAIVAAILSDQRPPSGADDGV